MRFCEVSMFARLRPGVSHAGMGPADPPLSSEQTLPQCWQFLALADDVLPGMPAVISVMSAGLRHAGDLAGPRRTDSHAIPASVRTLLRHRSPGGRAGVNGTYDCRRSHLVRVP